MSFADKRACGASGCSVVFKVPPFPIFFFTLLAPVGMAMPLSLLQMPRESVALLLSLLGVAGSPMLVQCASVVASVQDVAALRAVYRSAARIFVLPHRVRNAVAGTGALSVPAAFLRFSGVLLHIVRCCLRPVTVHGARLAYPGFVEFGVSCLQLASWQHTRAPLRELSARLELPDDALEPADFTFALTMHGLPADVLAAWIFQNPGAARRQLRRIRALLRLGSYQVQFFAAPPEIDSHAALLVDFQVLGVHGTLLALEPEIEVAGFLLP